MCDSASVKNRVSKIGRFDKKQIRELEGRTIGRIKVRVENIFDEDDPKEDKWLYRLANDIQVNTRKSTILSQLLFEEGDPIDYQDVNESMRILYGREYLLDVKLLITDICKDVVNFTIVAKDAWVIEPKLSFGRKGGVSTSAIGLTDGNFLGSGNLVSIEYEKEADRTRLRQRYKSYNFLGKKLEAELVYAELTDGNEKKVLLRKPFYSLRTRWSYGAEAAEDYMLEPIRHRGEIVNEYAHLSEFYQLDLGRAMHIDRDATYRLGMGVTQETHGFDDIDTSVIAPEDQLEEYGWLEFSRRSANFEQFRNLNYIAREVDIPLGLEFSFRYGRGHFNEEYELDKFETSLGYIAGLGESHLFEFNMRSELNYVPDMDTDLTNSLIETSASYHYFINGQNRWYVCMRHRVGKNLLPHEQFELGEFTGMRGYPIGFQRGDKAYLVNVERRLYTKAHWFNLIRFGVVGFVDVGRAWGLEEYDNDKVLASTGIGLRLHSSKSGSPAVVHINLSVPFTYRDAEDLNEELDEVLLSLSVEESF